MGTTMTSLRALFLFLAVLAVVPATVGAELVLPPGFTVQVYVSGEGFDTSERATRGMPSASTLAIDGSGTLFLARTGRRYTGGDVDDLWPIYRFPPGGGRLTKASEPRFLYGPPLPSVQIAGLRAGRDVLVSTFDRDRKIGVVYVLNDGHANLLAGGTPPAGTPPALVQPESAVADQSGNLYVADRARDAVVKLNSRGALAGEPLTLRRPRLLALGGDGALWVAADGAADAPWQRGPGEIWRLVGDAPPALLLRGPVAAGMALSPTGQLFVADRQGAEIFIVTADGTKVPFVKFTDGDAPRGLVFAPVTPATERAGIAGGLFVITISRGAWAVNEVVKISGPFEQFLRENAAPR
jgi:hypothetical protein